jgi:hypothetical protein
MILEDSILTCTLIEQVTVVRGKSDGINASLCERHERIEELNGT